MDWGGTSRLAEPRLLRLLFVFTILRVLQVCEGCKVDSCGEQYTESLQKHKIESQEPSVPFCTILREYGKCLKLLGKECRGNLIYHTSIKRISLLSTESNCTALVGPMHFPLPIPRPSIIPKLPSNFIPVVVTPQVRCNFHGKPKFRYCGLFGDPHLKTFDSLYQTCKLKGAWPLVDNPYLAVSVTNEPVMEGSPATVTTKVTVIIKSSATLCTQEKTYEAQSDQLLPDSFIDGTMSKPNDSVMLRVEGGEYNQKAEIYLRYIETTLIIRQVGKYLAFAARIPEEIVNVFSEDLQLCSSGCPSGELLDLESDHGDELPWEEALKKCQDTEGLSNEINNRLTDHYLDWCVFDVMTTGELASTHFTAAAHSAQADVLRFDPDSLKNRTTTKLKPRDVNRFSNASVLSCCHLTRILFILIFINFIVK